MKLNISAASSVGCVRENNEDMILVSGAFVRDGQYHAVIDTEQRDRLILALCDGMGGHNAGEVASSQTLHNLQYFFGDMPARMSAEQLVEMMKQWLDSISSIINSRGLADPTMAKMGTTLVALAYYAGHYLWFNCGDSRLYLLKEQQLTQLTRDHSLSNMLGYKQHSNVIVNCIGGGEQHAYFDTQEITDHVTPGSTLLLCSDGLTDEISDDKIADMLMTGANADDLCQAACQAGGIDNVSCCLIRVEQ
jgi:protein phosphatase